MSGVDRSIRTHVPGLPRRDFLKTSAGAAAAVIAGGVPSMLDAAQDERAGPRVSRTWSQAKRAPSSLIAVPKSGGAVGGIGETFVPNPHTGTEGISIPLPLTRGREDFGPELSVSYSVANGNGVFGLGWKLDLTDVARKTEGRLPAYPEYPDDDAYLLDGAELRPHGNPEPRGVYDVTTYRLRHESAFARIEHWIRRPRAVRHPNAARSFWCVTSRENITQIFGAATDAVVADPEERDRIFRWSLQLLYDGKGNIAHYQYKAEDGAGVPAEERGRPVAQTYLKRVRYGNLQPVVFVDPPAAARFLSEGGRSAECFYEGVFDYGEHGRVESDDDVVAEDIHAEIRPWDARVDAFSSYRAGFEVRTRRTCKRFLMFHRLPGSTEPALVGSLDFSLSSPPTAPLPSPTDRRRFQTVTQLKAVTRRGYAPAANASTWNYSEDYQAGQRRGVRSRSHQIGSVPPLTFEYLEFEPPTASTRRLQIRADGLPADGFADPDVALVDLFRRGLPDILWTRDDQYRHWKNTGTGWFARGPNVTPPQGAGTRRKVRLAEAGVSFSEITGDAVPDILVDAHTERPGEAGYCIGRRDSGPVPAGWRDYTPFKPDLPFRLTDAYLRLVDVTGDGRLDALRCRRGTIEFFENAGAAGFTGPLRSTRLSGMDELRFDDQRIHFADMTGDGLADLVLIGEDAVRYWPNLGRGRFGRGVTMSGIPAVLLQSFQPERLHLVDIDGSGPADLVYVDSKQVQCWLNISGNAFAGRFVVSRTPTTEFGAPQLIDLLGTGISGLLWATAEGASYLPLTMRKPFLLASVSNNRGRRTTYEYAPSTRFALEAENEQKPWKDSLPFPVYVLSQVVRHDGIAESRLVSKFSYAHGVYDEAEKALRGFGRVEQVDAEYFSAETRGAGPLERAIYQAPVRTTSWFHTGEYGEGTVSRRYRDDYYSADRRAPTLDSRLPIGASGELARESARALAGRLVRTEVCLLANPLDSQGPSHPYSVTEHGYVVELLPGATSLNTVSCHAREEQRVHLNYELQAGDPQVTHDVVLKVDRFGHVLESASVAYGRRLPGTPEQRRTLATYTVRRYAERTADPRGFRHGVLAEEQTYELHNFIVSDDAPLTRSRLAAWIEAATRVGFEAEPSRLAAQARLIAHTRHRFWKDDGTAALDHGLVELVALPYNSCRKAFTRGLVEKLYGARLGEQSAEDAGYLRDEQGDWWVPDGHPKTGAVVFDAQRFYLPIRWNDALGRVSRARYDPYALAVVETTDALMNVTKASIDYRTLQPSEIQDVNGNRTAVAFDALGRVAGTAIAGRPDQRVGDSLLRFRANLDSRTVRAYLDEPVQTGPALLGQATTRVVYDAWCYYFARERGEPAAPPVVCTLARETHAADLPLGTQTAIQHRILYLDGFERELQTKVRCAPGPAPLRSPDGQVMLVDGAPALHHADHRWLRSGATVYNNKGNPVRRYEPCFSATPRFDSEDALTHCGVTSVFRYDAVGRLVRTDKPDGTFTRVDIGPWHETRYDEGDTVLQSGWYDSRTRPGTSAADRRAAHLSRRYAETPTVVQFDPLHRACLTVSDNGPSGTYATQIDHDIQGNAVRVRDARGNLCVQSDFDMLGRVLRTRSIDSGEQLRLPNAFGEAIREWDSAGHVVRRRYDELDRLVEVFAGRENVADTLVERHIYGEAIPDATARNLRGRRYQTHTEATILTNWEFDFKGNAGRVTQTAGTHAGAAAFSRTTTYDALNRPISVVHHDGSEIVTSYDAGGNVCAVDVRASRDSTLKAHVRSVQYNARGQRTRLVYGNDVRVDFAYDATTFRVRNLTASRDRSTLQDLLYTYDAAGNVVEVVDGAQPIVCYGNQQIEPRWLFEYDAVYRLTSARGREHRGFAVQNPEDRSTVPVESRAPHRNDCRALAIYHQRYRYDEVGNLLRVDHRSSSGEWVLEYQYAPTSNRLMGSGRAGKMQGCSHDGNGNVERMRQSHSMTWDYANHLRSYHDAEVRAAYGYDASGMRVRKTVERDTVIDDRVYAGDFERFERRRGMAVELARHTTHVRMGPFRVSTLESTVVRDGREVSPTARTRFALHDHLESVRFELDEAGAIVSYEEFHPFGTTAYRAGPSATEVSEKRFRYLGKERDAESGLYYFGARYYAPWLGRWISCDPIGLKDGPNPYAYVANNPVRFIDHQGFARKKPPMDAPMTYDEARKHANSQNKAFRTQHGMTGRVVQSAHTARPREAEETGITRRQMDRAPLMQLHSRVEDSTLAATVTDQKTGTANVTTRHNAQEKIVTDLADRARGIHEQMTGVWRLTADAQLENAHEVEWRFQGTGLDQREVEAKRGSGLFNEQAALDKSAAVQKYRAERAASAAGQALETTAKEGPGTVSKLVVGIGGVIREKGGKLIPGAGSAVGFGLAARALSEGDYLDALVEMAGASEIPGVAQAADLGSLGRDIAAVVKGVIDPEQKMEQWWYDHVLK